MTRIRLPFVLMAFAIHCSEQATRFYSKLYIDPARFEVGYSWVGSSSVSNCAESTTVFRTEYSVFSYDSDTKTCSKGELLHSDQANRTGQVWVRPSKSVSLRMLAI